MMIFPRSEARTNNRNIAFDQDRIRYRFAFTLASTFDHISDVICLRSVNKMARIAAYSIIAAMSDDDAIGDRINASIETECNAMGIIHFATFDAEISI